MSHTTPQPPPCPEHLREDQIKQFKETGYLAFFWVLSPDETKRSRVVLSRITSELASDPASVYSTLGTGPGNQSGASFKRADSRSMLQLEPGYDPLGKPSREIERMVRKFMWFCGEDPVLFRGAGTRIVDKEAYDRLFVDRSGAPASCRAARRLGF